MQTGLNIARRCFCSFSMTLLLLVVGIPVLPVQALGAVFVTPAGSGDCSQASPCNLATGLSLVDGGGTLYAAAGTYTGTGSQVVLLNKSINFLGGWNQAVTGTPVRNPDTYVSILEGEYLRRVITIQDGGTVVVDGWTIRDGNATGKVANCSGSLAAGCGGGILVSGGSTTIEHCIIEDNVAATTTADPARTGYGGGIYIDNPTTAIVRHNTIHANSASTATSGPSGSNGVGGGIYASSAIHTVDLIIADNEIFGNDGAAAGFMGWGAGVAIDKSYGLIRNNDIHENATNLSSMGSGIYASHSDLAIEGNRILNNPGGEVLYFVDLNGTLDSNVIINPVGGYGIFMTSNNPGRFSVLVNNIIAQHSTANIALVGTSGFTATVNLYQNTVDDSTYGLFLMSYTYVSVANSIISHHSTEGIHQADSSITVNVNYTLFHGNTDDGTWDLLLHPIPTGDPSFVDETGGDYHIQANSAARDVAAGAGYDVDFEGDGRPMGAGGTSYDVGADEFWWKLHLPVLRKP